MQIKVKDMVNNIYISNAKSQAKSSSWFGVTAFRYLKGFLLVSLLLLIGASEHLYASHIVGGEISYRCLGGNRYEVTLIIYRDCENGNDDAPFDDPASVGIFDSRGQLMSHLGPVGGGQLLMYFMGDDTISTGLNPSCIDLDVPVCVHRTKYVASLVLPFRVGGYILAHQRCCRNFTISNIIEPIETGATYTAVISETALQECNQGAVFNEWPPVFVCIGEELVFNHSATDADGDQLVYSLCTPLEGATRERPKPQPPGSPPYQEVSWAVGFSEDNMMGTAVPITIDPNTGILRVTPDLLGQFVIGVCMEEYRNGELISTTRRDFQFNVIACGEVPSARFNAPDLQCGDLTINFENESTDGGYFEWYFDWPNADPTLSTATTEDVSFTYPDTGSYQVALLAYEFEGSACVDTLIKTINLRNTGLVLDYEITKLACGELLNLKLIDNSTDSVAGVINSEWIITYNDTTTITLTGQEAETSVPAGVTGTITLIVTAANGCTISETVDFVAESDMGLIADFDMEIIKCEDDYIVIPLDLSRDDEGEITSWTWVLTNAAGDSDTLTGQVPGEFLLVGFQEVTLSLTIESTSGCVATETRTFELNPTVNLDPDFELNASECEDQLVIDFLDMSYNGPFGTPVSWSWTVLADGEPVVEDVNTQNITLTFDTTVVLTITLCVTYELNGEVVCENTCTTKEITANLLGPDTFDRDLTICEGGSVQLNPNPLPDVTYDWSDNLEGPSPVVSPEQTTVYSVTITDTNINCSVVKEVTVNVVEGNDPMDFTVDNECGSLTVNLEAIDGDPAVIVKWTFGDGTELDEGDLGNVQHTYEQEGTYTICMITEGECPMEICKEVTVRFIDLTGLQDTIINCEGEPVELYPGADPSFEYSWEPTEPLDDPNAPNPTANVTTTTTFNVTISDPNDPDCIIERSVTVVVPDPIVLDVDDVVVLCEPTEITINATSPTAVKYTWRNGAGDIISEDSTLVFMPEIDEVITVTVEDIYGCETVKSVSIEFFKITFILDGDNPMCLEDTVQIAVSAPDPDNITQYMWTPADRIISGADTDRITVSPPSTTTYTVQIAYVDGCVLTGTYVLEVADFPEDFAIIYMPKDTIIAGNFVDISVEPCNPDYLYEWEPSELIDGDATGCNVRSVILDEDVDFSVKITNMEGCTTDVSKSLTVPTLLCEPPYIFVPNTFSPNDDGSNDILKVYIFEDFLLSFEFVIYNRWGQEIFKTTNLNVGWDGTFKGEDMPVDAYAYHLIVNCIDGGDPYQEQGKVNLIR